MKDTLNLYQQIAYNKRMSILVMLGFALFGLLFALAITVFLELPPEGSIFIIIIVCLLMFVQYSFASRMILGFTGARPARREEYPFIYHTVEGLAIAAGIPAPKCYIIESAAPNAFATGRSPNEGVVALTTGLIDKLNNEEIEGVIAHEIAHIQNYDIRIATIAIAFIGIIALISEIFARSLWFGTRGRSRRRQGKGGGQGLILVAALVFVILAPIFARILHLTLSRRREFLADSSGAWLTRNPGGLASALRKIAGGQEPLDQASATTAPLYIVNPLNKAAQGNSWFSTHPPLSQRIEILEKLSYKK
jgi:heat shock protein HtpX